MKTSVVLIGPMGAGKTTLGKKLARELQVPFQDTDRLISSKHGSIESIFEKHGEPYFRRLETEALAKALETTSVIATGGGVPMSLANQQLLESSRVIFLDTTQEHVIGKINLAKRPLLRDNPDRWGEIYVQRKETYQAISHATVFTGGKSLKSLLEELKEAVKDVL